MTIARVHQIDASMTRWYHCVTRCVRHASLLSEGPHDRKGWIEHRLQALGETFALAAGAYAVLDDRVHVLLRLDPDIANGWSNEDVVRRTGRLFPPRDKRRQPVPISEDWLRGALSDKGSVALARARLASISWFMKCLKEPLSRMANRQDNTRGAFFEERFKSVAILDEESLLAACVYIDLSPVFAGIAKVPESAHHTSIKARVDHAKAKDRLKDLKAPQRGSVAGTRASGALEKSLWLCPIEDRRGLGSTREGMLEGFSLASYLRLVGHSARLLREREAAGSEDLSRIFERLGTSAEAWQARLEKLWAGRLLGRYFAASRDRLRQEATRRGLHHLANLGGCPTR